ncbi:MAG TPA: hypothetical protein VFY84_15330, partial [Jiangellales bacterium]|nr:hypothetical protein [Jiangellales bacterium]
MNFGILYGATLLAISTAFIVYGYLLYTRRISRNRSKLDAYSARVAGRQAVAFGVVGALLAALVLIDLMVLL